MATDALILVVGLLAGILSGMFGVGGAVITTPGIRALGTTPIEAVDDSDTVPNEVLEDETEDGAETGDTGDEDAEPEADDTGDDS